VSAATIRNELATLEEMGFLAQPHTSGGRVPTDRGYRYYVEGLMDEPAVPADEQRRIAHQFHQVQMDLTEWLRLSAAVLAQSAHSASLITAPRVAESHVKHLELISIQDSVALLVLVLQGGLVQQQMLMLPVFVIQETLSAVSARLNRQIEEKSARQIEVLVPSLHEDIEREAAEVVIRMMDVHDQEDRPTVYYDGLANILSQMELSLPAAARGESKQQVVQSIRHMLELLQQGLLFRRLLPQVGQGSGVQVFIGGEGEYEDLRQFSVIVSRYGAGGGGSGLLGVLGPTRMQYGRAVAVVRFMTELLSDLAGELNG